MISIILIISCIASGCREVRADKPAIKAIPEYKIENFKKEFIATGKYARSKGWEFSSPVIPSDPDPLIQRGLHICSIMDKEDGDPNRLKDHLLEDGMTQRDWDTTLVIARAATASLCPEHKSKMDKWFYRLR